MKYGKKMVCQFDEQQHCTRKPQIVEIHMHLNVPIRIVAYVKAGGLHVAMGTLAVLARETAVFHA